MSQPSVLILDEPCAGLDPVSREQFLQFIDKLSARKNSPAQILVTHHVEEIRPFFTHALILANGRCIAQGDMKSVMNDKNIKKAFGASATLKKSRSGYSIEVALNNNRVA